MKMDHTPHHKGHEYIARSIYNKDGYQIGNEYYKRLVRCKECKYWYMEDGTGKCRNPVGLVRARSDNYCSYGEIEENEDVWC